MAIFHLTLLGCLHVEEAWRPVAPGNRSNAANDTTGNLECGNDTMNVDGPIQQGVRKLWLTVMRHLIKFQLSFLKYRRQ